MLNPDLDGFVLHVRLEDSGFTVVPFVFSNAEMGLCWLFRPQLSPDGWRCVVSLVQLPFVLRLTVTRSFGNGPGWLVLGLASVWTFLRVVGSWPYDLWCRVKQDQRVETFYCPPCIQTKLRRVDYFRSKVRVILRAWSHFVFLFGHWELQ